MTDERLGDLLPVLRRLPPGTGVVVRHYATPPRDRRALLRAAGRIADARRLTLVAARGGSRGGIHGPGRASRLRTWSAHTRREAFAGIQAGAAVLFVSPVFATRSHPGARPLPRFRSASIGRDLGAQVIALGGMDARRWRRIRHCGFDGWAAIDAWAL
jgi:thiamine-phosphate pyrophosphorylase